jgi:hypothetical protein
LPRYEFNWQLVYYFDPEPALPAGSRLELTAHYDNSPNNPHNPDPTKEVRWGEQTWDEMMGLILDVAVDAELSPWAIYPSREPRPREPRPVSN